MITEKVHTKKTSGNSAAESVMVQRSLAIGSVNDPLEHEADAIADKVMSMQELPTLATTGAGGIQRKCTDCEEEEKLQRKPLASFIQRKESSAGTMASDAVSNKINASKGGGTNMESHTQSFMQSRFGADFGDVKIHTGGESIQMNRELNAKAFTVGNDIYFNEGQYNPGSNEGKHLLAHELTHTVQQGRGNHIRMKKSFTQQSMSGRNVLGEEDDLAQNSLSKIQPKIQRSTAWGGAVVHETINLANMVLGGNAPITWHQLNGIQLTTDADANRAINLPAITTGGSGTTWHAQVTTVPVQTGSADETVLASPPWNTVTTKVNVGTLTGIAACTGAGNSTFSANGSPSDASVFQANRRHENHHVADHLAAFNAEIGTWDKNLQLAKTNATQFNGVSTAAAIAALWAAMGGTPQAVAKRYRAEGLRRGNVYHGTATGKPMEASNPHANASCSTSSVDVTNPA